MSTDWLRVLPQYCLPHHLLSRLAGKLVRCDKIWWKRLFINWFIQHYGVEMSEAQQPDPSQYRNFEDFFIRHLKPDARPLSTGNDHLMSPVDGSISQLGRIEAGTLIQAKGLNYSLSKLLGHDDEYHQIFQNSYFSILYLAPKDYHRVHMPVAGRLLSMRYVPGRLFSVNPLTTQQVSDLFARNERLICHFETAQGPLAVIFVGAMLVASIHTQWQGLITPCRKQTQRWDYHDRSDLTFAQGDELGYFTLGSTVILLMQNQQFHWQSEWQSGKPLRLGQLLGSFTS